MTSPSDLAAEMGIDSKRLRHWLRDQYPRPSLDQGQRWVLTADQVRAAREHFGGTGSRRTDSRQDAVAATHRQEIRARAANCREAAERYRPATVRLLLVAEAPPLDARRYFYFPDVADQDSLFWSVVKGLYGARLDRPRKADWLARLVLDGVFMVDLSEDPLPAGQVAGQLLRHVPDLVERCKALRPEAIVLIKTTVYDASFAALLAARLPVVDRRIPFPGSGQQRRFQVEFAEALRQAGFPSSPGTHQSPPS